MDTGTTTSQPLRRLLAFALLTVAGALLLPAIASASPTHFTKVYKIEKQLDLNGHQSAHEHLYCEAGDYAIDGMWRVDNVDQANPQIGIFGDMRDITVTRSYSDLQQGGDRTKWH
ncbi:MAG TPA: hypothetical protein PKD47_10675, partial [Solirubrobacterales bacterium]|nr:hypothetical protein [Solirubrobacterales bacterium]